jgi:urea transport system permease protein
VLSPTLSPADDAAIRSALAQLGDADGATRQLALQQLAASDDARVADALKSFGAGGLFFWKERLVFVDAMRRDEDNVSVAPLSDALTRDPLTEGGRQVIVRKKDLTEFSAPRRDRAVVRDAVLRVELRLSDETRQRGAIVKCGDLRDPAFLERLQVLRETSESEAIVRAARMSVALIRLSGRVEGQSREDALAAARDLGELQSARGVSLLEELIEKESAGVPTDADARSIYSQSLDEIESYQRWVRGFQHVFSGISRGSILILMALGLSITFGLMGVINMAHGELMMIGAYATYEVQRFFVASFSPSAFDWYFVVALPTSFLAAAIVGFLIERLVVRHLYGRPLETLLATWGVGLILIQLVRSFYGDNIAVNSPEYLRGGTEVVQDITLPYNRCFIIVLCTLIVAALMALMRYTKFGLRVRATMQNRAMASALGVNTRRIDGYTFALGSGLAGIAGCALTLIGGVTPDMGQTYIVDSFLVVVTGGVGELMGVVCSGLGMGLVNKGLEPFAGAVWGKVLVLVCVILFIQWRPAGLFPPKGRLDVV